MRRLDQNMWELLTRVLSGEADPSEKQKFKQWLEEKPANRSFFQNLQSRWEEEPDKNAVYHHFLFDRESGTRKLRYKIREEEEKASQAASSPQKRFSRLAGWKVAASILLVIGIISAWAGMRLWSPPMTSYETSGLEQRIITLPDGSSVRLNKNSTLSFREGFLGSTRKVTLKGEAFFQVRHNADKPFVVHIGDAVVRDIGTSFNVKQAEGGKIIVAMKEGKAALKAQNAVDKRTSILTKNEIGIFREGRISIIKQQQIHNYLGWIYGRLVFDNIRLDKVTRQLDNIYDIRSSLEDSSLSKLKLTAYTNNNSLDEVLSMIALSLDINYRKDGKRVIWMKKDSVQNRTGKLNGKNGK